MPIPSDNAPGNSNPFVNNKFNYSLQPQGQAPQSSLLPSGGNPVADGGFGYYGALANPPAPVGMKNAMGGNNSDTNTPGWGDVAGGAITGLGNYLTGAGQSAQNALGQMGQTAGTLGNLIQHQNDSAQQGSENVLANIGPDKTIVPFEKMALARALANQGPPTSQAPAGLPTQNFDNSNQWKALKDTTNQYFSPESVANSQMQYNKQLLNVDPYAQPSNMSSMYGADMGGPLQDELTKWQMASQDRRLQGNNNAQTALQQALDRQRANADDRGSLLGSILSGIGGAVPSLLGMFGL